MPHWWSMCPTLGITVVACTILLNKEGVTLHKTGSECSYCNMDSIQNFLVPLSVLFGRWGGSNYFFFYLSDFHSYTIFWLPLLGLFLPLVHLQLNCPVCRNTKLSLPIVSHPETEHKKYCETLCLRGTPKKNNKILTPEMPKQDFQLIFNVFSQSYQS